MEFLKDLEDLDGTFSDVDLNEDIKSFGQPT